MDQQKGATTRRDGTPRQREGDIKYPITKQNEKRAFLCPAKGSTTTDPKKSTATVNGGVLKKRKQDQSQTRVTKTKNKV